MDPMISGLITQSIVIICVVLMCQLFLDSKKIYIFFSIEL